ncbi:MAG: response regulator [Acidobacteria bacterium]|nr:response regulator [Acidobacteriota bacterium]MBV9483670.1 response regulator [Acidobacteriota bacterium]
MPRPTLLVAEPEPSQALSVRKLVLESAKFNVLTAHSTREALDMFHMFPKISAAVLVGDDGVDCNAVAEHIKASDTKIPVVFLTARIGGHCRDADYNLPSGEPETLVDLVRSLIGDPRAQDTPSPS